MILHREKALKKAMDALNEIQSVCRNIGVASMMAQRCYMHSKLGKERWKRHRELINRASELKENIRDALRKLE